MLTDAEVLAIAESRVRDRFGPVVAHGHRGSHLAFSAVRPDRASWEIRVPAGTWGADTFNSFGAELSLMRSLQHPRVIPVVDQGVVGGLPFYAVPSAPDMLDRILDTGKLTADEVVTLLSDVASALAFCHERGILHGVLGPRDIQRHAGAYVLDGFAFAWLARQLPNLDNVALGNPTYLSPELCRGDAIDARSDIYSLGAVAFLCLEGDPPQTGPTSEHIVSQKSQQPSLSPRIARDHPGLARLVESMLAPEPKLRPPNARDLRQRIAEIAHT